MYRVSYSRGDDDGDASPSTSVGASNIGKLRQGKKSYTMAEYINMADAFFNKMYGAGPLDPLFIEREYWRHCSSDKGVTVEYGNDIEGTAFPSSKKDRLGRTPWNLRELPRCASSTLRFVDKKMPGILEPMLYIGMVFSTFAWHVEDHFLYSINYNHMGSAKLWYGVPGDRATDFERVAGRVLFNNKQASTANPNGDDAAMKELEPAIFTNLMNKAAMFSPESLLEAGVPVVRAVQQPGDFVVTFPKSYHGGFNCGFNCAEAVNFAASSWYPFASDANRRYSDLFKPSIIPLEELIIREVLHNGEDISSGWIARDAKVAYTFVRTMHRLHSHMLRFNDSSCRTEEYRKDEEPSGSTTCSECGTLSYVANFDAGDKGALVCCECAFRVPYLRACAEGRYEEAQRLAAEREADGLPSRRLANILQTEDDEDDAEDDDDSREDGDTGTPTLRYRNTFEVSQCTYEAAMALIDAEVGDESRSTTCNGNAHSKTTSSSTPTSLGFSDMVSLARGIEAYFMRAERHKDRLGTEGWNENLSFHPKLNWKTVADILPPRHEAYERAFEKASRDEPAKRGPGRKKTSNVAEEQRPLFPDARVKKRRMSDPLVPPTDTPDTCTASNAPATMNACNGNGNGNLNCGDTTVFVSDPADTDMPKKK